MGLSYNNSFVGYMEKESLLHNLGHRSLHLTSNIRWEIGISKKNKKGIL